MPGKLIKAPRLRPSTACMPDEAAATLCRKRAGHKHSQARTAVLDAMLHLMRIFCVGQLRHVMGFAELVTSWPGDQQTSAEDLK